MALSYPYSIDFLARCLTGESIPLKLLRYDEMSGVADGRFWASEMATPLWGVTYPLHTKEASHARELNAKVNALDGMSKTFLWADPSYYGPASGQVTGLGGVQVASVRAADRGAIGLQGCPPGFTLQAGDRITIPYASGRVYMGEFSEGAVAGAAGNLAALEVRPYVPFGIVAGASVQLARPYIRAMAVNFEPFAITRGRWGTGASITILQKI